MAVMFCDGCREAVYAVLLHDGTTALVAHRTGRITCGSNLSHLLRKKKKKRR